MMYLFVIVWILRLVVGEIEEPIDPNLIISARCHIRCLTQLKNNDVTSSDEVNEYYDGVGNAAYDDDNAYDDDDDISVVARSSLSLQHCKLNLQCEICSKPCDEVVLGEKNCQSLCSNQEGCEESCRFVKEVVRIRGGVCPRETQAVGVCTRTCQSDADCALASHKCCPNGCGGWTCHPAAHLHHGMAEVVGQPLVHPLSRSEVRVTWSRPTNSHNSLLYILQRKTIHSSRNQNAQQSWTQVALTGELWAEVGNLMFGYSYYFRVWSVNIYGTTAPSPPSIPYTFSKQPNRPDPPRNLSEGDSRIQKGFVSIDIHWLEPKFSDLPITRYKILWREKEGKLREWRQVVAGNQLHATLNNLKPDTQYFLQVQAISEFGEVKLKSNRTVMYITTYPLPRIQDRGYSLVAEEEEIKVVDGLIVSIPFFHNGLLKVNLSWTNIPSDESGVSVTWLAEGCSHLDSRSVDQLPHPITTLTHMKVFTIYDLRFGCKYMVMLSRGSQVLVHYVETPSCSQVIIVGSVQPDCPHSLSSISAVTNVQHKFISTSSGIALKIAWTAPLSIATENDETMVTDITSYLVTWMKTELHIPNRSTLAYKILPKESRMVTVAGLESRKSYIFCIQATTRVSFGRIFSLRFTTPSTNIPQLSDSEVGFDGFDLFGGLTAASTLSLQTLKPILFTNSKIHILEQQFKESIDEKSNALNITTIGQPSKILNSLQVGTVRIEYHVLPTLQTSKSSLLNHRFTLRFVSLFLILHLK